MKSYRIPVLVVTLLGLFMLIGLVGAIWLVANKAQGESIAMVSGLTGTALGALGSVLSHTGGAEPQNVNVTNPPSDPVPVEASQPEK